MYKAKQKTVSLIVTCLTLLFTVLLAFATLFVAPTTKTASAAETTETTETLSIFGSTGTLASDSSSISWTGTNVTFTNQKAASPTAIRTSDSDHFRVYAYSAVTISTKNGTIKNVVITCTSGSYANVCVESFGNDIATASGSTVTITPTVDESSVGFESAAAQWRLKQIVVTYTEASSEPACTHEGAETTWVYDSATNEHYQQCNTCEAEIDGTRAACSDFTYSEYTTADGVHTRTATCTICGGEQTESGNCEVSAEYVREGDQHTQTGTCSICNASTSVTEACTLSYNNVSNDNKTHNMTSTCSVCNQSVTTENVACTFGDATLDGTTLTYTCEYCNYSYTEEATMYTVTYAVPEGIATVDPAVVAENFTTVLPGAGTVEGYTFVGWTTAEYAANTAKPESVYEAGYKYTVTEDVTLYALYTYSEGETEETWNLATMVNSLAVGKEIVIVASGSNYALGTTQNTNNRTAVAVTKGENTVTIDDTVQIITLEAGIVDGTFAFNVDNGYLYAASSSSNQLKTKTALDDNGSWLITIDSEGIATITAQGTNTRNLLKKNSSSALFACYASGQNDVSIYVKEGGATIFYTTSFGAICQHTNTTESTTSASCTETGMTRVVCECGYTVSETEIPALGHEYGEDNLCIRCGEQDPASIDYTGYYYISFKHSETVYYADNSALSSNRYYARTETELEEDTTKYIYRLVKTSVGIYSLYEFDGDCYQENVTVEKIDGIYRFYATVDGDDCQFLLNAGSTNKYIKFYKASNATQTNYAQDITLTPVELSANIDSASITIGSDLTLNYYVTMSNEFAAATMKFTFCGEEITVSGTEETDGRYKFSLSVPPQYMAENVKAELVFGGTVIASQENYSIQTYAQNQLNDSPSGELKQLLTDMLYYGAAAQNYKGYNTENLVKDGVANIGEASTATPDTTDFKLVKNEEISSYGAWFTGAKVYFGDVNNIVVTLSTTENVTLTINGTKVEVTSTTVTIEGIVATDFDKTYEFVLSYDGVVMQTLTYSVNAYAYAMKDHANTNMSALAIALYRYGAAAEAYTAAKANA